MPDNYDKIENMSEIPNVDFYKKKNPELEFEIIPFNKLFNRTKKDPDKINTFHRIKFFQIVYIINGTGKYFIDFKEYNYEKTTGSLISFLRQ